MINTFEYVMRAASSLTKVSALIVAYYVYLSVKRSSTKLYSVLWEPTTCMHILTLEATEALLSPHLNKSSRKLVNGRLTTMANLSGIEPT